MPDKRRFHRWTGVGLFLLACVASLAGRAVADGWGGGPSAGLEVLLSMLAFSLASAGLILMVCGAVPRGRGDRSR